MRLGRLIISSPSPPRQVLRGPISKLTDHKNNTPVSPG